MKIYFFLSSYLILFQNNWFANSQTCTSFPYVPGPTPAPNFPQKYSTRVEVNQFEDDTTYEMQAFYDNSKRKAALDLKENNVWKRLIFNYETDEIYSLISRPSFDVPLVPPPDEQPLYETSCETYSLKENLSLNYYFGYSGITYLSPKSASTFFRFDSNSRSYEGEEYVRGILCDVYVSCQYNEATKANYTLRHYFSKPNITFPGNNNTFPRIIMRARYSGIALKSDGSLKEFNNTFDYHEFKLEFDRDDVFQVIFLLNSYLIVLILMISIFLTPGRVYCENRKKVGVKPPVINGNIKFSEEIVSKGIISHITNIEFDANLQIVRYETRDRFANNSEISFDKYPHIFVNDYTIGVSYITNKHTGRCRIQSLDPFAFASDSNFTQAMLDSGNGYAIRSKSAESLLELDHDYIFTGQRAIDDITSDIFVAKNDISKGISIVNEYIFTPQNFTSQTVGQREKNIPKRLAKKSLTSDFSSVSTFYNFETNEINIRHFDVSKCYRDDSLISFKIVLKPRTDIHLQILRRINLNKILTRKIYKALGNLTGEISLRFSIPRVTLSDDGYVYIRSAILPGPEPLNLFKLFPNKLLTSTGFTYSSNIQSAEACALKCLASSECLSFDYSNSSKGCYLNKKHYSNGTFSSFTTTYDHYSRNSLFYVKFSEKYIVWSDMSLKFNGNRTSIETEVTDFENQTYPIILDSVSIEEVKKDENRFGSTFYLSKYNLKKPNFRFKKNNDDLKIKTNIDECAKKCTEEIGSPCNSFHYCFLTSECLLNENVLDEASSNFEQNSYCDIYEKDSLAHYSFFKTKATINPNDKKINPVQSLNECASKCDNELDIHCRSFNYCPNTRECYLSDRHVIDGSIESSSNLLCDHYSRKYISDFTYIDTNEIPLNGEIVFKDVNNIDLCSFECINSDGFGCKSFDYCPDSKTCILNSGQKPIESGVQSSIKDKCAHYRREYFFATSSKSQSSDSSKSVLTALSIIFGLLSVVIGGIASILLIKKYGEKSL